MPIKAAAVSGSTNGSGWRTVGRAETRTGLAGITAPKFLDNIAHVHIKSIGNVTFLSIVAVKKGTAW
jgi:hypothetical protein